jgi:NADH:ubiquinone oxidoreductase subunit F (NADH-binding)
MSKIQKRFNVLTERARLRWEEFTSSPKPRILVGAATCGRASGALGVIEAIRRGIDQEGIDAELMEVGCIGICYAEPLMDIITSTLPRISFGNMSSQKALKVIKDVLEGKVLQHNPIGVFSKTGLDGIPSIFEHPMLKPQVRIVLKNCGFINPESIEHYIANDGYLGFVKALGMRPDDVIEQVKKSGLRGRGGAGFPTGRKWEICRAAEDPTKYLICNGDEGDPGAFMNRSLIESDPHALLEGMLIAGYAIGAEQGYIYIRAEYPLAIQRLKVALNHAREWGLLGENILGSRFSFDIKIREGAGAFVCGEETALIQSIEGKRGMPRSRPPYPAVSGLWGKPTVINNVETLGTLPHILRNGAEWYRQYGTQQSRGTKTFSLVGKVKRTGLIEVPMGISLRRVIYEIGGGIQEEKGFKAVQTGGPSGGCIPAQMLDLRVDYESLSAAGSIMGSGGMIVMDEDTCPVDIAHYFLDFTQKESCGKCTPCRIGTRYMVETLDRIRSGRGEEKDLDILASLGELVRDSSLCGLGQTAPNPVLTTIRYFKDEYEAHIREKKCPATVCRELIHFFILPEKCVGCLLCLKACPSGAISGRLKELHTIDDTKCIKCGACYDVCPSKIRAVIKYSGDPPRM